MFLPRDQWSEPDPGDPGPCFRQGDLVRVEWVRANPAVVKSNAHSGEVREIRGIEVRDEVVALVGTCCDLVNHAKPKRKGVLITPLRPIPDNIRKSEVLLTRLKTTTLIAVEERALVPANLFYYGQSIEHPEGVVLLEAMAMIDFHTLVRGRKLAELTNNARVELRERIKLHFTRTEP